MTATVVLIPAPPVIASHQFNKDISEMMMDTHKGSMIYLSFILSRQVSSALTDPIMYY